MNRQQIMFAVEQELELLKQSIEGQIAYLTAIQHFLEFDLRTISLYDGMDLDEHLRYYDLQDAIEDIEHRIATLKVRKPVAQFNKIDESSAGLER